MSNEHLNLLCRISIKKKMKGVVCIFLKPIVRPKELMQYVSVDYMVEILELPFLFFLAIPLSIKIGKM